MYRYIFHSILLVSVLVTGCALTMSKFDPTRAPQSVVEGSAFYEEILSNETDSPFLAEPSGPSICEKPKGPCHPVKPLPQD